MAYEWATWLADALRRGGVEVVEHPGWRTRGQVDGAFTPRALIFHHDASPKGPSPTLPAYLADLSHPGAQCWVDTAGRWHLIAAGRMWHAGDGAGWGDIPANAGNSYAIGVETDHTTGEPWPPAQLDGIRQGMAAICRARGWQPDRAIAGHREYAPGRKPDPDGIDLRRFRRDVAALIDTGGDMALSTDDRRWLEATIRKWCKFYAIRAGQVMVAGHSNAGYVPAEVPVGESVRDQLAVVREEIAALGAQLGSETTEAHTT